MEKTRWREHLTRLIIKQKIFYNADASPLPLTGSAHAPPIKGNRADCDSQFCCEHSHAASWLWSSAIAHLEGRGDQLVKVKPLLEMAGNWRAFLAVAGDEEKMNDLRKHERTGRPVGTISFIEQLESALGCTLKRGKPGPKGKPN